MCDLASVYLEFEDVSEFMNELKTLVRARQGTCQRGPRMIVVRFLGSKIWLWQNFLIAHAFRFICGNCDVGLLRVRKAQPLVCVRICAGVCVRVGLRFSSGRMAIWID